MKEQKKIVAVKYTILAKIDVPVDDFESLQDVTDKIREYGDCEIVEIEKVYCVNT